jgi:hypothetical protein
MYLKDGIVMGSLMSNILLGVTKQTTTYDDENPCHGFGQAHKCYGLNRLMGYPPLLVTGSPNDEKTCTDSLPHTIISMTS